MLPESVAEYLTQRFNLLTTLDDMDEAAKAILKAAKDQELWG